MTDLPALRHLDYGRRDSVQEIGAAGLQAILDGSDIAAWRPLLTALAEDPWGSVAVRVERVLDHLETYGTARLLRGWLVRCRAGATEQAHTLAELRHQAGLSQRQLAVRLGCSQAQVARIETSAAPSLRSLSRYLDGLDLTPVALVAAGRSGARIVRLPAPAVRARRDRQRDASSSATS